MGGEGVAVKIWSMMMKGAGLTLFYRFAVR